jgi:hypothetical protein
MSKSTTQPKTQHITILPLTGVDPKYDQKHLSDTIYVKIGATGTSKVTGVIGLIIQYQIGKSMAYTSP